jgi:hypothetical protein
VRGRVGCRPEGMGLLRWGWRLVRLKDSEVGVLAKVVLFVFSLRGLVRGNMISLLKCL